MAYVRTILKISLPDDKHELHVIRPSNDDPVLFSLVTRDEAWSVRSRPTVRLPHEDAIRLGKFLCGIQSIDGVTTERIEREITARGVGDVTDDD